MGAQLVYWGIVFVLYLAIFTCGMVWGYLLGRNAKIGGIMNLEPIIRLPEDGPGN